MLSELPPTFLQSFVAALFSTPERAVAATKLIGAPLALACRDALASEAVLLGAGARDDLLRLAQITAVNSRHARRSMLAHVAALENEQIPCVAIKGLATAYSFYSAPYLRLLPDGDILVHGSDLPALCAYLKAHDFVSVVDPASDRAWGALTKASFAPVTPRDSGNYYFDFHRLAIDYPACRGVPTAEIFASSRHIETENGTLRVPSVEHSFLIMALHGFRDFYEPRGLKALFDAAFLLARHQPDWRLIETMARRGRSVRRTIFYRDLLTEIGIPGAEGLFAGRALGASGGRLVQEIAQNMRSLALPRLPDGLKLRLEMCLYDSPLHMVLRNGERLAGLVVRRTHDLPGLPVEEAEA
jgi:hypothetical protein